MPPLNPWVSSDAAVDVTLIDPLTDPAWDRLVRSHADHTIFHTAAWARVLTRTYGHRPVYLRCAREGELVALIPMMEVESRFTGRRAVCLPFTDFCGPLIFGECSSQLLINALSRLARERNWDYFEVRGPINHQPSTINPAPSIELRGPINGPINHQPSTINPPPPSLAFHGHKLDLSVGMEEVRAGFTSSVRRAIGKAERSDLTVQVTQTREAMRDFYRMHVLTRGRHGVPPQPESFFSHIYEEIIKPGLGFVVLAQRGARAAAGAVFFQFGKTAVYKFGASQQKDQELRANNLVMWEGIQSLSRNGVESLHFGRTSLGNEGLRRFKSGWGTTEEKIEYFKRDTTSNSWVSSRDNASGIHNTLFRLLPPTLNRLIGTIVYPHLD